MNIPNKLLSSMAQKITPYEWASNVPEDILRFDTNTLPSPPPCIKDFCESLMNNCPINEYGDPSYSKLKTLIAKYEDIISDAITITNSGDEALDIVSKAFLNPGDFFIIQPPTYEMFRIQSEINRGIAIQVPLTQNFEIDLKKLLQKLKETQPKIVFICNPNNPTGTVTSNEVIELVLKTTKGIVLVDEAYREFYGKSSVQLLGNYDNLVILRSFSKSGGMAGARIGYLLANPQLSKIFDSIRFPMGVSYFSYKFAELLLEKNLDWIKSQTKIIFLERERLTNELSKLGFDVVPSKANFLLVKFGNSAKDICENLKRQNILVRDRSNKPYLKGYVRITVRNAQENTKLIESLRKIIKPKYDGLIFDMDGVLVDVSKSYREAIRQTASYFLNKKVTMSDVEKIKGEIGMNNDWDATYALIKRQTISYEAVKSYFQSIYLGSDQKSGLIDNEELFISKQNLLTLKKKYKKLGIATGRPKEEAEYVIKKNKLTEIFDCVIAMEDVKKGKPSPDCILMVIDKLKLKKSVYIGDSPSDVIAAREANMPSIFVGKQNIGTIRFRSMSEVVKFLI